ncbi:hypothetical protein D3C85_1175170 [compost metagenome]
MAFIIFFVILGVIIIFLKLSGRGSQEAFTNSAAVKHTSPYHYGRRRYLMTQSENSFFKLLTEAVGTHANVFPQVRLSALLCRTQGIERRYWHAALARINQKSVDYVLCNKLTGEVLLVIELDDPTHDTSIRQKRDADVNEMLEEAGVPFLRFRDVRQLTVESIAMEVYEITPTLFMESNVSTQLQSVCQ